MSIASTFADFPDEMAFLMSVEGQALLREFRSELDDATRLLIAEHDQRWRRLEREFLTRRQALRSGHPVSFDPITSTWVPANSLP